jgi:outer membrane receptor protein involved in Fe transport
VTHTPNTRVPRGEFSLAPLETGTTRLGLRSLGASRTLVLVNGRRWVPGGNGADAAADLASIPSAVVERVEILTGGASALHGADAVAGVVNVVTRRGGAAAATEASVWSGTSGRGDGTVVDVAVTAGASTPLAALVLSAGWHEEQAIQAGARPFSAVPRVFDPVAEREITSGSSTIPAGRTLTSGAVGAGNALWTSLVGAGGTSFIWDPGPAGTDYAGYPVASMRGASARPTRTPMTSSAASSG